MLADSFADLKLRKPITGIAGCCARALTGHAAAEAAITLMNSRRLIASSEALDKAPYWLKLAHFRRSRVFRRRPLTGPAHVRFGSEADICSAKRHVRFTPES